GKVGPLQSRDREHRLIPTICAHTDQTGTNDRGTGRVELLDPQMRVGLGKLGKPCGHFVDVMEVLRRHTSMLALVNQYELRAGGILRETSLQQLLADDAEGIRGEETDIIVLGNLFPAWGDLMKTSREDEPTQND